MKSKQAILGLIIAAIAYTALATINTTSAIQALIALPGAAGLLLALWELVKANINHQHRLDETNAANSFVLSATSHMAETAFDKHVEFSESYVSKANDGLGILFREGPTVKALDVASQLYGIRIRYVLWETKDVSAFLDKFERALREIGADEHLLNDVPVGEGRAKLVQRLYENFKKVVNLEALPDQPTPEIAVTHIIDRLRDHLGVTELTALRKYYLAEATKRMK